MKTTELRVLPTRYREPSEVVIKACEDLLELAKSGELQSISAVCGNHNEVWTASHCSHYGGSLFKVIGAHMTLMLDAKDELDSAQDDD
jgi:hypothetical protein